MTARNIASFTEAIEPTSGTASTEKVIWAGAANGFSVHLVTTGTLTGATGWAIEGSNGPELNNRRSSGPDTTTFDWVDLGLTISQPAGAATNQLIIASDWRGGWIRVRWVHTGVSGTGNVAASVYLKGNG